jgi:hypothetical protein
MGILSKLVDVIKKILSKLWKAIVKFVKKYWVVILILAVIYFAPMAASWLTSVGAPSWLSGSMAWIASTLTPYLTSAVGYLWSATAGLAASAWGAFASASLTTQLALGLGAAYLLAPEETSELVSEVAEVVGDVTVDLIGAVASGVGSSLFSNPVVAIAGVGLLAWWLWPSSDNSTKEKEPDFNNRNVNANSLGNNNKELFSNG